jgi:hypothetical protein
MDNLDPDYLQFVEDNGSLNELVQEIIDRCQYSPNFFSTMQQFIESTESPFETVEEDGQIIRKLKQKFQTQNLSNAS